MRDPLGLRNGAGQTGRLSIYILCLTGISQINITQNQITAGLQNPTKFTQGIFRQWKQRQDAFAKNAVKDTCTKWKAVRACLNDRLSTTF